MPKGDGDCCTFCRVKFKKDESRVWVQEIPEPFHPECHKKWKAIEKGGH